MVNNIFKGLFLLVAVLAVVIMFRISQNLEQTNRYKITTRGNMTVIFDTQAKKLYYWTGHGLIDSEHNDIKRLP